MKAYGFACALLFGLAAPAAAQDVRETVDALNEAVTRAQLQLAKDLGLIPPDDAEPAPEAVEAPETVEEAAVVEAAPTVDIMAAEQMFWTDYYAAEEGKGEESGKSSGDDEDSD